MRRAGLSMDGRWYQAKREEEYVSGYKGSRGGHPPMGTGCVFQVSWVKSGVSDSTKRNPLAHSLPARERERVFGRKAWIGRPWSGRGTTG